MSRHREERRLRLLDELVAGCAWVCRWSAARGSRGVCDVRSLDLPVGVEVSEPERLNYRDYQKAAKKAKDEGLELDLKRQLDDRRIGGYEREYRFCERKWRFDFAWPSAKVAVEVDGGIYGQGRHNRGPTMEKDNEKLNKAATLGWVVLRFGPKAIKSGEAVGVIETALAYWSQPSNRSIA